MKDDALERGVTPTTNVIHLPCGCEIVDDGRTDVLFCDCKTYWYGRINETHTALGIGERSCLLWIQSLLMRQIMQELRTDTIGMSGETLS